MVITEDIIALLESGRHTSIDTTADRYNAINSMSGVYFKGTSFALTALHNCEIRHNFEAENVYLKTSPLELLVEWKVTVMWWKAIMTLHVSYQHTIRAGSTFTRQGKQANLYIVK